MLARRQQAPSASPQGRGVRLCSASGRQLETETLNRLVRSSHSRGSEWALSTAIERVIPSHERSQFAGAKAICRECAQQRTAPVSVRYGTTSRLGARQCELGSELLVFLFSRLIERLYGLGSIALAICSVAGIGMLADVLGRSTQMTDHVTARYAWNDT